MRPFASNTLTGRVGCEVRPVNGLGCSLHSREAPPVQNKWRLATCEDFEHVLSRPTTDKYIVLMRPLQKLTAQEMTKHLTAVYFLDSGDNYTQRALLKRRG